MSSPLAMQASGLRTLAQKLSASHLVRSGAVARKQEAEHLISMIKDASETLDSMVERGRCELCE